MATIPEGRLPIISMCTVSSSPSRRSLFCSASASVIAAWKMASISSSRPGSMDRMSTSIQFSDGIEFTEVPPPMRPML